MRKPIVFVGTATMDFLALVDRLPASDERIRARKMVQSGGGPAANAAVAAASLGAPAALISAVGEDSYGSDIVAELHRWGVDISGVQTVPGGDSSASLILIESGGQRAITYYGGVLNRFDLDRFPEELVQRGSLVHADGNFPKLTLKAFTAAKHAGVTTSLDGGNIPEDTLAELLPYTDILITDRKSLPAWARSLPLEEACRRLQEKGPEVVGVTLGQNGSVLLDRGEWLRAEGMAVEAVDTTGAGDNYHGAFVYGIWRGLPMDECLRLANVFASLSCLGLGGRGSLPDAERLKQAGIHFI